MVVKKLACKCDIVGEIKRPFFPTRAEMRRLNSICAKLLSVTRDTTNARNVKINYYVDRKKCTPISHMNMEEMKGKYAHFSTDIPTD